MKAGVLSPIQDKGADTHGVSMSRASAHRAPRGLWGLWPLAADSGASLAAVRASLLLTCAHWPMEEEPVFAPGPSLLLPRLAVTGGAGGDSGGLATLSVYLVCTLDLPGSQPDILCIGLTFPLNPEVRPHLGGSPAQQKLSTCLNPKCETGAHLSPHWLHLGLVATIQCQFSVDL